jgi:hypothetical protein
MAEDNGSGIGLTLKQLVLEIRLDVRALRDEVKDKVNRAEFTLLNERFERAMSGESQTAYAKAIMEEYSKLKLTVKQLEKDRETATIATEIAKDASDKQASNRKWILGLAISSIIQAAVLIIQYLGVKH